MAHQCNRYDIPQLQPICDGPSWTLSNRQTSSSSSPVSYTLGPGFYALRDEPTEETCEMRELEAQREATLQQQS